MYLLSGATSLGDVPDAGATLTSDYSCQGSYNVNRYCSPAFDALIARSARPPTRPPGSIPGEGRRAAGKFTDVISIPLVAPRPTASGSKGHRLHRRPAGQTLVTAGLAKTGVTAR